jgi:MFS family permease
MPDAETTGSTLSAQMEGVHQVSPVGSLRWVICGLLFFAATVNYIDRQVIGLLKPTLQEQLHWNEIDYANIVFYFQVAYAAGLLVVGRVMDWLGTRRGFGLAVFVWSIAAMFHAAARSVFGFSAARFALGLGEAGSFPNVKIVATTLRDVHTANHHSWSAVAWVDGQTVSAPAAELIVYDRVGGGDGFASGFFYGLMNCESPEQAIRLGWAHGALLTTFPGDTTMATLDQVRSFAAGGSARIQR